MITPLPLHATLEQYREQAAGSSDALAGEYHFKDWAALANFAAAMADANSPVFEFESAVETVIAGDAAALASELQKNPALTRARSTRDHHATLLHYIAANGVEDYRQKTPPNAVEIATILLKAGADPDATANMYGGPATTMAMLVSSAHPAQAGLQVALLNTLVDFGASPNALLIALAFGYLDAAEALASRGANVHTLPAAAGLGRVDLTRAVLPAANPDARHQALALSTMNGQPETARVLLDAGVDPNRFNPAGMHAHSTPLHQAALAGHQAVVRLLIEHGADPTIQDKIYQDTPLGWANHAKQAEIAKYLGGLREDTQG